MPGEAKASLFLVTGTGDCSWQGWQQEHLSRERSTCGHCWPPLHLSLTRADLLALQPQSFSESTQGRRLGTQVLSCRRWTPAQAGLSLHCPARGHQLQPPHVGATSWKTWLQRPFSWSPGLSCPGASVSGRRSVGTVVTPS